MDAKENKTKGEEMNLEELIKKNVANPNFNELASVMALDAENFKIVELTKVCKKIIIGKPTYEQIEKATGVPWNFVGCLHFMEASLRFEACLHNGQPWNKKTTIVPIGRGPWNSFVDAAIDALKYDKLADKPEGYWTLARMLAFSESYNGTGYRRKGILSPYVFAYTNLSGELGKYVKDHVYDPKAEHNRPSVGAILLMLKQMEAQPMSKPIPTAQTNQEKVFALAKTQIGVKEFVNGSNPQIEAYHRFADKKNLKSDLQSVSWCSSFMCWLMESSGFGSTNDKAARSWLNYGKETKTPVRGDIVIFWRESKTSWKGHVALFDHFNEYGNIICLGGNQSDAVCYKEYLKDQLLGFRTY